MGEKMNKIEFSVITMKDGEIHIEKKDGLGRMLTDKFMKEPNTEKKFISVEDRAERQAKEFNTLLEKNLKTEIPFGFFKNTENDEFFTQELEIMSKIISDEVKLWRIKEMMDKGFTWGTFRRYKTKQPRLVKSYKTFKGANQNTFWRNH